MSTQAEKASAILKHACELAGIAPPNSLGSDRDGLVFTGEQPILPSSFPVGLLAQSSIAAAAYSAAQLGCLRGLPLPVLSIDMADAERECTGLFELDGITPDSWAPLSGLYACRDGHVRIHANFDHHRNGACQLLGLSGNPDDLTREDVVAALENFDAVVFETAAAQAGLPISAARTFAQWDASSHGQWLSKQPLFTIRKIGEAKPLALRPIVEGGPVKPLAGIRVLDLTRILAGPVCGRTLALYGADVMLVNSPRLPNIDHIADTSRGKRSVHLDLDDSADVDQLTTLVQQSEVFIQGYRPGGLAARGYSPEALAAIKPGLVSVSLSAYGHAGEWSDRRGFDSLVQTAMGFNYAEAQAAGESTPKSLPVQILDFASGYLMAFATSAALIRQQQEGGSWHVDVSLEQTGHFLRNLGRTNFIAANTQASLQSYLQRAPSGFGELSYLPHSALFDGQALTTARQSVPPGTDSASWSQ